MTDVARAARTAVAALGRPDVGVVLGSGWRGIAEELAAGASVAFRDLAGFPRDTVRGQGDSIVAGPAGDARAWYVTGRLHLYEGHDASTVALPVRLLAAAGARAVLLTCAAGGLADGDRPGDLVLVADHLNLTGTDPARGAPAFTDLHEAYDPALREVWRGVAVREGILASVAGPSFETPAEIRMMRALGADLISMSVALETIAARIEGLRVAALACVANPGAGLGSGARIDHASVLDVVSRSVAGRTTELRDGIAAMAGSA